MAGMQARTLRSGVDYFFTPSSVMPRAKYTRRSRRRYVRAPRRTNTYRNKRRKATYRRKRTPSTRVLATKVRKIEKKQRAQEEIGSNTELHTFAVVTAFSPDTFHDTTDTITAMHLPYGTIAEGDAYNERTGLFVKPKSLEYTFAITWPGPSAGVIEPANWFVKFYVIQLTGRDGSLPGKKDMWIDPLGLDMAAAAIAVPLTGPYMKKMQRAKSDRRQNVRILDQRTYQLRADTVPGGKVAAWDVDVLMNRSYGHWRPDLSKAIRVEYESGGTVVNGQIVLIALSNYETSFSTVDMSVTCGARVQWYR